MLVQTIDAKFTSSLIHSQTPLSIQTILSLVKENWGYYLPQNNIHKIFKNNPKYWDYFLA